MAPNTDWADSRSRACARSRSLSSPVNAVCPGLVLTETLNRSPEMVRQQTERQLIPRGAEPAEVAQAYLYLMRGSYTTGQVLIVDGGRTLT